MLSLVLGFNRQDNAPPGPLFDYVKEFRGINYIKDAYLKLAYYYLLQNDAGKYDYYVNLVKTRGNTTDEKRPAGAMGSHNDARPDLDLLKARFYFDGGYYSKALAQLAGKDENTFKLRRDKMYSIAYYLGRIYDRTGKTNECYTEVPARDEFRKINEILFRSKCCGGHRPYL